MASITSRAAGMVQQRSAAQRSAAQPRSRGCGLIRPRPCSASPGTPRACTRYPDHPCAGSAGRGPGWCGRRRHGATPLPPHAAARAAMPAPGGCWHWTKHWCRAALAPAQKAWAASALPEPRRTCGGQQQPWRLARPAAPWRSAPAAAPALRSAPGCAPAAGSAVQPRLGPVPAHVWDEVRMACVVTCSHPQAECRPLSQEKKQVLQRANSVAGARLVQPPPQTAG